MDIRNLVDKGWSFDDILDEVKKEYAAESKRKKNEEDKPKAKKGGLRARGKNLGF